MPEFTRPDESNVPMDLDDNEPDSKKGQEDFQTLFNLASISDETIRRYLNSSISLMSPPEEQTPTPSPFTHPSGTMSIERYQSLQPPILSCVNASPADEAYLNSLERQLIAYLHAKLGHYFFEGLGSNWLTSRRINMKMTEQGPIIGIPIERSTVTDWSILAKGIMEEVMTESFPYGLRKDVGLRFIPCDWIVPGITYKLEKLPLDPIARDDQSDSKVRKSWHSWRS